MRKRSIAFVFASSGLLIAAGLVACGDDSIVSSTDAGADSAGIDGSVGTTDGTVPTIDGSTFDSSSGQDAGGTDASDAGQVERGPIKIPMPNVPYQAYPDGLFWQYGADAALYIADENNNSIVRWDDKKGFSTVVILPDQIVADGGSLGGLVRLEDGTFFVNRFGYGVGGGMIYVAATGDAGYTTGLDVTRKRLGVALMPTGTLLTTYFKGNGAAATGAVATLTPFTGGEKDFISNLGKPVGVLYDEGRILTTDQLQGFVVQSTSSTAAGAFQNPLDGGPDAGGYDAGSATDSGLPDALTILAGGDSLCPGPNGTVFALTNTGTVYQIALDGTVTAVPGATGLVQSKGLTYDGANKRLFVGEIDTTNGSSIHIYPVN